MTESASLGATCPIPIERLSAVAQKSVGPAAPAPIKLMAAKGLAPMPPKDLVTVQFVLTFDADEKVATAAKTSLQSIDPRIANAVLGDKTIEPAVLGFLAENLATNESYAEKLLLNPSTPSIAFIAVAKICSEATAELIANNQARLLETPDIVRSLIGNPHALRSTVERVVDFLVRSNIILEEVREFEEAFLRLTGEERMRAAASMALPLDLIDESLLTDEERAELGDRKLIDEDEESEDEDGEHQNLQQRLRTLTIGKKIALATRGNKEVRSLLLRDSNRLVALAAVTSPQINESEIVAIAQSRTVHGDVIAHIARDKKSNWVKNYQVKVGLVNNPKTPLPEAMKFLPHLLKKDVKSVSKSRNIPIALRNLAVKLAKGGE